MLKSFIKSTVLKKAIYADSWIILLSAFVFSFIIIFAFSMATSIIKIEKYFINPDAVISSDLDKEELDALNKIVSDNRVYDCNLISTLHGVLETKNDFSFVELKEVDLKYFNRERLKCLSLDKRSLSKGLIVSDSIRNKLNISLGDKIAFVDSASSRAVMYQVVAFYTTGLSTFDDAVVFYLNDMENRKGEGLDKIYNDFRRYELVFYKDIKMKIFGDSVNNAYDSNIVSSLYTSKISDKVNIKYYSPNQIINSLNSIKFILILFILLSVFYTMSFIKNFQKRAEYIINLYNILGCSKTNVIQYFSLVLIALISCISGISAGIIIAYFFKFVLLWLNSSGLLNLDYYMLDFKIVIPYVQFLLFIMLILISLTLCFAARVRKKCC